MYWTTNYKAIKVYPNGNKGQDWESIWDHPQIIRDRLALSSIQGPAMDPHSST